MAKNKMKELVNAVDTTRAITTVNKETAVAEKKDSVKFADLPLISVLDQPVMNRAKDLLEELDAIQQLKVMNGEREKELEEELERIQRDYDLPGLRYGRLAFRWQMMDGRKTLSAEKLIECGVSAEIIERCKVAGKDFAKRELKIL